MSGPNGVVAKPPAPSDAAAAGAARALPAICYELRRKVLAFLDEKTDDKVLWSVQSRTRHSIAVIEEALRRYRPEQLSLSYNGGKDCLVLLILILACLPTRPSASETNADSNTDIAQPNNTSSSPQTLKAIYIVSKHPFPEVESFVAASTTEYHLDLNRYAMAMRPALEAYIAEKPDVKAVFMGTRRTDPHAESLTDFTPTDGDWPQIMRVHPVIDWQYAEIWGFIRHLDIPFCSLYNQGFTSLGGLYDTRPNPALALDDSAKTFRPAYELVHDDEERLGRDR